MEMLGLRTLFSPSSPAPRSGPLCRSAASGHSEERARALLAPPPLSGGANRPPLRSPVGPAFCRETLGWRLRGARPVWAAPRGPSGRGGTASFPPRLPRGRRRRLGVWAARPLNGWG